MLHKGLSTAGSAGAAPAVFRRLEPLFLAVAVCLSVGSLAVGFLTLGCSQPSPAPPPIEVFQGASMGTTYTVKVATGGLPEARRQVIAQAINAELTAVDAAMSTYREDSELSRFNRHAVGEPFHLSPATAQVFGLALDITQLTGGAFDITVGPLVDAWGFGPGKQVASAPDAAEIARFRESTGSAWLKLEEKSLGKVGEEGGTYLYKEKGMLTCDLSAIAKGYAVDQVAEALDGLGLIDYLVEVGGELRARGHNAEGKVWRIGVERPQVLRGAVQRIVPLADMAMATSGDYRNIRQVGEEWVSHILDPRTGYPVPHTLASVTVLHASCARADALATAFMVLGAEEGLALAEREGLAVLFLSRDGERFVEASSTAFGRLASGGPYPGD